MRFLAIFSRTRHWFRLKYHPWIVFNIIYNFSTNTMVGITHLYPFSATLGMFLTFSSRFTLCMGDLYGSAQLHQNEVFTALFHLSAARSYENFSILRYWLTKVVAAYFHFLGLVYFSSTFQNDGWLDVFWMIDWILSTQKDPRPPVLIMFWVTLISQTLILVHLCSHRKGWKL